jgi:putative transposase
MSSVVRSIGRRKQRRLGRVEIVRREVFQELELNSRVELIRSLIPLGLMQVQELLEEEVRQLAGERYQRKDGGARGTRDGSNPGSVALAGQRLAVRVPRVRAETGEMPLACYAALHTGGELDEGLLRRVLYGISCRDYEAAAQAVPGAIGLSSSTVSRKFIRASAARLKALQERDLSGEDFLVVFLDGKSFAQDTLVVALGVTMSGEKRFLGFVETGTENEKVLSPLPRARCSSAVWTSPVGCW